MKKTRIVKLENGMYQIQQRHFLFFWWWVPAWVNSWLGAAAPSDTFTTLQEAELHLTDF